MKRRSLVKWVSVPLTLIAALLLPVSASHAVTITFFADLSGPAESPTNASPGTGTATVIINDTAFTMDVTANFSGLIGNTSASHIHCCTALPGTGTAIVATQTPSFIGFPLGVTAGTFHNTFDMTLASSYNPAFITAHGNNTAQAFSDFFAGMIAGDSYYTPLTS
jgi:CHRD domain-containing protein